MDDWREAPGRNARGAGHLCLMAHAHHQIHTRTSMPSDVTEHREELTDASPRAPISMYVYSGGRKDGDIKSGHGRYLPGWRVGVCTYLAAASWAGEPRRNRRIPTHNAALFENQHRVDMISLPRPDERTGLLLETAFLSLERVCVVKEVFINHASLFVRVTIYIRYLPWLYTPSRLGARVYRWNILSVQGPLVDGVALDGVAMKKPDPRTFNQDGMYVLRSTKYCTTYMHACMLYAEHLPHATLSTAHQPINVG